MKKNEKPTLILQALEQLLDGRRFHEITMEEVALAAGVGKGTLYLYFKDKDALFARMAIYRVEQLCLLLESLPGGPLESRLEQAFALVGDFIVRHRAWFGASGELAGHVARLREEEKSALEEVRERLLTALRHLLEPLVPAKLRGELGTCAECFLWIAQGWCHSPQAEKKAESAKIWLDIFRHGIAG